MLESADFHKIVAKHLGSLLSQESAEQTDFVQLTMRIISSIKSSTCKLHACSSLRPKSSASLFERKLHTSPRLNMMDISGIFPPIVTSFDAHENIDWNGLKTNMDKWNKIPFSGYTVQGSNGEYAYMTSGERLELVKTVKSMLGEGKLLLAGSGCESTRATVEMTNAMADAGADAALVVTPCFYKSGMTDAAMYHHFKRVADEAKMPVIIYNVPPNTGIDLNAEVCYTTTLDKLELFLPACITSAAMLGYYVLPSGCNQAIQPSKYHWSERQRRRYL